MASNSRQMPHVADSCSQHYVSEFLSNDAGAQKKLLPSFNLNSLNGRPLLYTCMGWDIQENGRDRWWEQKSCKRCWYKTRDGKIFYIDTEGITDLSEYGDISGGVCQPCFGANLSMRYAPRIVKKVRNGNGSRLTLGKILQRVLKDPSEWQNNTQAPRLVRALIYARDNIIKERSRNGNGGTARFSDIDDKTLKDIDKAIDSYNCMYV